MLLDKWNKEGTNVQKQGQVKPLRLKAARKRSLCKLYSGNWHVLRLTWKALFRDYKIRQNIFFYKRCRVGFDTIMCRLFV